MQNRHVCKLFIKITAQDEAGGGGAEALWSYSTLWTLPLWPLDEGILKESTM